jgi:arylsulfatase A-like enzyme
VSTTDNGAENFTWPDGGQTPFAGGKGMVLEGGFRVPCIIRWPGKVPAGKVENGLISGLDWFPTFLSIAGSPNIAEELKKGTQLGDRSYKVHLDGYDQTELITGKGPSKRHELFYFAEATLGAARIDDYKYRFIDQPGGWIAGTVHLDWPILSNLRLDPFERGYAVLSRPPLPPSLHHRCMSPYHCRIRTSVEMKSAMKRRGCRGRKRGERK